MSDRGGTNKFRLKRYPLNRLKVLESTIIGPYKEAKSVSAIISRARQTMPGRDFKQHQWLMIDPTTMQAVKMYLVTRIV